MDTMKPSRTDSPQLQNGSIILLGLSKLAESKPATPLIVEGSAETSPLKRIQPKLAMSIELDSEYPHEKNFEMTPRSLLIREFQTELETTKSKSKGHWKNLLRNPNDLIPEIFEDDRPDFMSESTDGKMTGSNRSIEMKNFMPLKEYFHLESGENLGDLSWVYTPSIGNREVPGTPKPVFLVLSKEWARAGSPAKVDWFELKVPSNSPKAEEEMPNNHLDIEVEAKEIKLSVIGQDMEIDMSIEN